MEGRRPRRPFAFAFILLLLAACRTTRPAGESPLAPLTSTSPAEAAQQLTARRDEFRGERSVIRIRLNNGSQSLSAKGQMQVGTSGDLLITVYTPLNTTAARLYAANGEIVFLNDIDRSAWKGSAADFAGSFGFLGPDPSILAFLILGLPPRGLTSITYSDSGLQSARFRDLVVAYDPPVYPPKRVVIVRGMQRVEIDHREIYASPAPIEKLVVPAEYRCCVLPQL